MLPLPLSVAVDELIESAQPMDNICIVTMHSYIRLVEAQKVAKYVSPEQANSVVAESATMNIVV